MGNQKKVKKKNRKLLVQIGLVNFLYSIVSVIITCVLIYSACIFVYLRTKQDQLADTLDRVNTMYFTKDYTIMWSATLLEYLEDHPDMIAPILDGCLFYEDSEDLEAYYDYIDDLDPELRNSPAMYVGMKEEYIREAVKNMYWSFVYDLFQEEYNNRHKELMVVDVSDAHEGMILFYADDQENHYLDKLCMIGEEWEEWGEEYVQRTGMGSYLEGGLAAYPQILELKNSGGKGPLYSENFKERARESLTGYYPVYVEGQLHCVLVITYDWSDFQDRVKENVSGLFWIALAAIVITQSVLLAHIYVVSVRPLRKIKRSLSRYIESKDSAAVVSDMNNVWQRNEFGLLADDISVMVREIDDYTHENMELAGEREKSATELELAAKIQKGMLREDFPQTPEYEIFAMMDPAKEVGGDFYDFFEIDATHLALVIADVAGKGVPGALFMMSALTVIRGKTLPGVSPAEILSQVNEEMLKGDFGDMFVTVWMGILDLESGIVTAANAGHEYPMIRTGEQFRMLKDKHGFIVGGMPGVRYTDYEIDLSRGGTLFVYTDGLPEATASSEELYGTDRIVEALNLYPHLTPAELVKNVKLDVDLFVGEAEQFDDLTILCISYHPSAFRGGTEG